MRAVVQRVEEAKLWADGQFIAEIGQGLAVYVGFGPEDDETAMRYILEKVRHLRIFEDENGKLNLSVEDTKGEVLWIPNFTLYGDCRHGRRPGYSAGAPVEAARAMFAKFCDLVSQETENGRFGIFQANMRIHQSCCGPVTLLLDSQKAF